MSERETAETIWAVKETAHDAGKHSEFYAGMDYATKYVRADIAEQREMDLEDTIKRLTDEKAELIHAINKLIYKGSDGGYKVGVIGDFDVTDIVGKILEKDK